MESLQVDLGAKDATAGTFTFPVVTMGGGVADVRCKTCNKRVKFHLSVPGDEHRGRPRVVRFLRRPDHMPGEALLAEVRTRNRYNATGEEIQTLEGFVKASELIE